MKMDSEQWFERAQMMGPVGVTVAVRKTAFFFLVSLLASPMLAGSADAKPTGQDEQPDYLQQALDIARAANEPHSMLLDGIAEGYITRGDKDKALAILDKMTSSQDKIDSLTMLADGFFLDHEIKLDPSLLEQASELNAKLPNNKHKERNYIAIGSVYSENNMPDKADQALEAAMACAELSVQDDSTNKGQREINAALLANRMASIYAKAGRTNEFEKAQARAAILIKEISTTMFRESGYGTMAKNYAAIGQYDRSLEIARKIKDNDRKTSALGDIAFEMGKAGKTVKAMEIVDELSSYTNKFHSFSLQFLAMQQANAGVWPNAYTVVECIDKPKDRANTYLDFISLHLDEGNRQEALKLLQKTRSITNGKDPKQWDRIFALLAGAYADAGLFPDAIEIADALSDEPPFYGIMHAKSSAYALIAEGYTKNGKFDEAIKMVNALPNEIKKLTTLIAIADIQSDVPEVAEKTLKQAALQINQVNDPNWRAGGFVRIEKVYYKVHHPKEK